jgi:N-acetylglucosaminyldiphosphoundecaprenol N-acetyl-beta-D-mannosaminyltransferase
VQEALASARSMVRGGLALIGAGLPGPVGDPPHAEFLGLRFSALDQAATIRRLVAQGDAPFQYVVTPNAVHVVMANNDPAVLLPIYRKAWLSLCDSQIVRGLARLRGLKLPLVTGSSLVARLLEEQNAVAPAGARKRLLLVGPGREWASILLTRYPRLDLDVLPAPHGLATDAALRMQIADACVVRRWDILLLCVGCPAQELIAAEIARRNNGTGVALCVGASIDFLTGQRRRAPRFLQVLALEWAFRLASEPRRLLRRYLIEAPRVFGLFVREVRTSVRTAAQNADQAPGE